MYVHPKWNTYLGRPPRRRVIIDDVTRIPRLCPAGISAVSRPTTAVVWPLHVHNVHDRMSSRVAQLAKSAVRFRTQRVDPLRRVVDGNVRGVSVGYSRESVLISSCETSSPGARNWWVMQCSWCLTPGGHRRQSAFPPQGTLYWEDFDHPSPSRQKDSREATCPIAQRIPACRSGIDTSLGHTHFIRWLMYPVPALQSITEYSFFPYTYAMALPLFFVSLPLIRSTWKLVPGELKLCCNGQYPSAI
ncbi:hypothetical protein EDD16DRAFT_1588675 [Pisolithus croceorrhizus]|nr:hypothetical protein EDD16DRAFT_1588675 [Pisolithus croceorrhizus]